MTYAHDQRPWKLRTAELPTEHNDYVVLMMFHYVLSFFAGKQLKQLQPLNSNSHGGVT